MKLMNLASNNSFWRGIDYHHKKMVRSYNKITNTEYFGEVRGNNDNIYHVTIDIAHPRRSTCDCAFANGRRVICKHMIALDLAIFPEKEKEFMDYIEEQNELYYQEIKQDKENEKVEIKKYVMSLSKKELQEKLLSYLNDEIDEKYNKYYD